MNAAKKKRSLNAGFTLIELLVVIAVIGILASVVIASTSESRTKAKIAKAQEDLHSLDVAINLLQNDTGKWPNGCIPGKVSNPEGLVDAPGSEVGLLSKPTVHTFDADCFWTAADIAKWHGPYAHTVVDPWGSYYFFDPDYCTTGNITISAVISFGPNKQEDYSPDCPNGSSTPDDVILKL